MRKENIILPGQTMHTPKRLKGTSMENKILKPHSGISESSRKRKFITMDKQSSMSKLDNEYGFPKESCLQQKISSLSGRNLQESSLGSFLSQSAQPVEPISSRHLFQKDQFDGQNNFPATLQTCNGYFNKTGAEKISSSSSRALPHSIHYRGPPLSKVLAGETLTMSNWQPQAYKMLVHSEEHITTPIWNLHNELAGKAEFGPGLQDLMIYEHKNSLVKGNQQLEVRSSQSECLRPLGLLQQSLVKHDGLAVDLDGKACSFQDEISFDLKQNGLTSNSTGINVGSNVGTGSLLASPSVEQNEDGNIQITKKTEGSDFENFKHSFVGETSPEKGDCPATIDVRHDPGHGSLKSDEKGKSLVGKVAPTVAEKLWDGSLQLNSSATVCAVAFFKSGEKMPDIKWSESVEVKGKVRLEAFEKYIQDLPRSRNRGLMVISLCWKEGSSETGLAGMKKVAKGYKEGERVGFAQLSPGIDLYICPRSETIITILAKHGFFKGMAAVEDNRDSLIGCVVWRRNRTNSKSAIKKSERKNCSLTEGPVNSLSDPSTQIVAENNVSSTQADQESIPVASGTDCVTLESAGNDSIESKNFEPTNVQLELHNSSTKSKSLPAHSVQSNSPSVSVGLKTSCSHSASHWGPVGQSLEVEAPLTQNFGQERVKPNSELQGPILSLPSDAIKELRPRPDYDDLPEFDYGISCGVSQTPTSKQLVDGVIANEKLPAEGFRNMDDSVPPTVPTVKSLISNQRRSENLDLPKLPLGGIKKMPPLKNACEPDKMSTLPIVKEKNTAQSRAIIAPGSTTAVPRTKNLFDDDDDDDMPEWFPPDVELHKQLFPKTNRPSTTLIKSKVPNSTFESLSPVPTSPLLTSQSLTAIHPPISTQSFPHSYHCHNIIMARPVQPRPANGYTHRNPSSLMGFNSNPLLRPPSNPFDVKFPIHPAGWRGWRS